MTPQDRLAAALDAAFPDPDPDIAQGMAAATLAADPTIAADMELGRRIRDANDPLLRYVLASHFDYHYALYNGDAAHSSGLVADTKALRAALTEGEK